MNIRIKHYDQCHESDIPDGCEFEDVLHAVIGLLVACGFAHETILGGMFRESKP